MHLADTLKQEFALSLEEAESRNPVDIVHYNNTPLPLVDWVCEGVREVFPVFVGGAWQQNWEVYDLDAAIIAVNRAEAEQALLRNFESQAQQRLDDFARTLMYDGILSACTYATSTTNKFRAEGQYCVDVRDKTWEVLHKVLTDVKSGIRPIPIRWEDVEGELPELVWPS